MPAKLATRVLQRGRSLVLVTAVVFSALSPLADGQESPISTSADTSGEGVSVYPIKSSHALRVAINEPLKRATTDQLDVVIGYSDVALPPLNPGVRDEKPV